MKSGKRYIFNSIFTKFVLAFFFVGFLPLSGLGYFFFGKLPQDLERDMILNYNQILQYTGKNIETKIEEYNQISQLVYNYHSGEDGSVQMLIEYEQAQRLEDFLRSTVYSDRFIESAFLLDTSLDVYSYFSKNRFSFNEKFSFSLYPKSEGIPEHRKELTILPTHREDYFFRSDNDVISFVRNYLNIHMLPEEEQVVTVFCIEVNTRFLNSVLEPLYRGREGKAFIVDKDGYPIFSSDDSEPSSTLVETLSRKASSSPETAFGYVTDDGSYLFYREIESTDWILAYEIEKNSVFTLVNEYLRFGIAILAVLFVALLVLVGVFSQQLYRPIKNIMNQMKQVESGDLDSEVSVRTHDEIQQLAEAFNRMVRKLNVYIQNAYVARIKQKETELNAIRSQIRPHYLYNTLEIIRMSALEEKAGTTQEMILALSEQLKYVIGYSQVEVTLQRELEMVRNYFKIIHIRYDQRIRLEIDIPDSLGSCQIPKLVIQPLIENSVIHGLKQKVGNGTVRISAAIEGADLKISIIDDGIGIEPERLRSVQKFLGSHLETDTGNESDSIGLTNVNERLKLLYGEASGVEIESKEHVGTLVTVRLPARETGDL